VTTCVAAATGKLAVIDRHLQPRGGACMTAIAWRRGNYMVGSFTGGDGAVMTAVARCRGLTVVYG
jgi:hypothetical protein